MQPPLRTSRLSMSPVSTNDADFVRELVNSAGWLAYIGDRNVSSTEQAINYIQRLIDTPDLTYWVVSLKATCMPIGIISFIKRTYLAHFDIGFALLPAHMGQGYAYEAASHLLATVMQLPEHDTILATTLPHNTNSIRLLTKLGLRFSEEIIRDGARILVFTSQAPTTTIPDQP